MRVTADALTDAQIKSLNELLREARNRVRQGTCYDAMSARPESETKAEARRWCTHAWNTLFGDQ